MNIQYSYIKKKSFNLNHVIIDSDTTIVAETNIDSSEAEIEAKVEIEEE